MTPAKIDHRELRTLTDVRIAREKLKYALALEEKEVTSSFSHLGGSVLSSFKSTAYTVGVKLAYAVVINFLSRRRRRS